VNDRATKRVIAGLFLFLYVPFLYQHGYQKAFIGHGDFPTIYAASRLAFLEGRSPYVAGAFDEARAEFNRHLFPYLYPPPSLLAFYPFALVSYDAAKLWLLVANHLSFLGFLYLFFFRITAREPRTAYGGLAAALASVYVLTFYPVVDNLLWGQLNLVVLALLGLSWHALKRGGRALSVALPLSVAILLKTYPLVLVPLLLFKRRYGAAAALAALLLLYAVVAWAVLPRGVWGDWVANVLPTGGYGQRPFNLFLPVAPWNHSLNGFWTFLQDRCPRLLWLPSQLVTRPLAYLSAAAVGAATLGLSYLCSRRGDGRRWLDLEFALFLQMMFLVAPLSWEHHLVYLLPSALLAINLLLTERLPRAVQASLFAALCVAAWDFPRDEMFHLKGLWVLTIPVKFYAALAVWVCTAWWMWASLRGRAAAEPAAGGV
jgi:hypothetical protein